MVTRRDVGVKKHCKQHDMAGTVFIRELQRLGVSVSFSEFSERVQNMIMEHVF